MLRNFQIWGRNQPYMTNSWGWGIAYYQAQYSCPQTIHCFGGWITTITSLTSTDVWFYGRKSLLWDCSESHKRDLNLSLGPAGLCARSSRMVT